MKFFICFQTATAEADYGTQTRPSRVWDLVSSFRWVRGQLFPELAGQQTEEGPGANEGMVKPNLRYYCGSSSGHNVQRKYSRMSM